MQLFFDRQRVERDPILGAVGVLQFEIIEHRLQSEYKVSVHLRSMPYKYARWVEGEPFSPRDVRTRPRRELRRQTPKAEPIVLFENDWALRKAIEDNPNLRFLAAVQPARSGSAPGSARHRDQS